MMLLQQHDVAMASKPEVTDARAESDKVWELGASQENDPAQCPEARIEVSPGPFEFSVSRLVNTLSTGPRQPRNGRYSALLGLVAWILGRP